MPRVYPLKAQDRAIRADENLRHFAMTGKLLDPRLTVKQVVALRFASDGEFRGPGGARGQRKPAAGRHQEGHQDVACRRVPGVICAILIADEFEASGRAQLDAMGARCVSRRS